MQSCRRFKRRDRHKTFIKKFWQPLLRSAILKNRQMCFVCEVNGARCEWWIIILMKQEQPNRTRTRTHSTAFPCVLCPQTYFTGYRYKKRPTTLLHNELYTPESRTKNTKVHKRVFLPRWFMNVLFPLWKVAYNSERGAKPRGVWWRQIWLSFRLTRCQRYLLSLDVYCKHSFITLYIGYLSKAHAHTTKDAAWWWWRSLS